MSFLLTVLRASGKRLAKLFTADGGKRSTDKAARFVVERREVRVPAEFFAQLSSLEGHHDRCVMRAVPGKWFPADEAEPEVYRLLHPQPAYADGDGRRVTREQVRKAGREPEIGETLFPVTALPMFVEEPTPWVLLDFEGIEFEPDWRQRLAETAAWLKLRLPDAFADCSCWFQATGSAADPTKPDLGGASVRMRLGFVLDRGLTQDQLEAWLGGIPGLDPVTFRPVQEIYVGRPVFAGGLVDPIPVRSGVLEGLEDVVPVPDSLPEARRSPGKTSFVPPADELAGSSDGLLECPELDEALAGVSGEAGSCRDGLGRAAWSYIRAVGRSQVDVAALTARLTEEGLRHRSAHDVAGYGLLALVRWWLERAPADDEKLPDFGPARADRDRALAELHQEIAQELALAAERIALRRELKERLAEAQAEAQRGFPDKPIDPDVERELRLAKARAGRRARKAFLAEHGLDRLPPRAAILHTGSQGSGKSRAVAEALAGLKGGNVLLLVPTLKKAEETEAEIERQIKRRTAAGLPVSMFVKVWRGRLAPPPEGAPAERMCQRPMALIDEAQKAGCRVRATFCGACPMRLDCRYLDQLDTLQRLDGRLILVAAHDAMFTPLPFRANLAVIDEGVVLKAARSVEIAPERLLDAEKWEGAAPLFEIARTVTHALAQSGRELEVLREAGVDEAALKTCAKHLNGLQEAMVDEIAEAGKAGIKESRLSEMISQLKLAELRSLALLFGNLRIEITTGRPGTNATRLVRGRVKTVINPGGGTRQERRDVYVVSRPCGHGLSGGTELILLDGTGNLGLNQHLFGEDVIERRCAVDRQGAIVQVTSTTNSKYQLLARPEAERNRRGLRLLIRNVSTALGGSLLVGCTKELEEKLKEEDGLEGVQRLHFGAERGLNSAEGCRGVIVIGREQPWLASLEDDARGYAIDSEEPFVSVLDAQEAGELGCYRRRRRMRDGSEVWAEVRSHPDPFARALLEQVREAAIAQMADRVRSIWNPKLIVIATSVPVDLDVTQLVTQGDLMRAAGQAAAARPAIALRGWWLAPQRTREPSGGIRGAQPNPVIDTLLQFLPALPQFPALLPLPGNLLHTALWSSLSQAEAFRRAAATHPGLRALPPPGGVLRECLRRHGLIVAWSDLPAVVPELAPDAVAVAAVKDAEKDQLEEIRDGLRLAPYRMAGRRGHPGTVAWDPARVADPAAALAALLGDGVTVDWLPARRIPPPIVFPEAAPALPRATCVRCSAPPQLGGELCSVCAWLAGAPVFSPPRPRPPPGGWFPAPSPTASPAGLGSGA